MTAFEHFTEALLRHGSAVKPSADNKAMAQCPAHDDGQASLSIGPRRDNDGIVIHCHAGCERSEILAAIDLTVSDLFDNPRLREAYSDRTTYVYPDGRQVHREPGKKFRQSANSSGTALFHADQIANSPTIYVTEGEKDVLAIESIGGTAVCPAMGAGKAHKFDWTPLRGRQVIILRDKDEPGHKHAQQVADLLDGIASSITVAEAAVGKDAADHIAADKRLQEFVTVEEHQNLTPRVWRATELQPARQAEWVGKGWLPKAATTILVGDEGIGKSLFWVHIVAAVTTGKPLRECGIPTRDPAVVALVLTEDDWATTVLPRLIVAGANLDNIRVICTDYDGSGAPIFPRDIHLLHEMEEALALVVVDAWLDTVPSGITVRDPQGARQALHPWKELATKTGASVLLLTHTNRVASAQARDKYGATAELRKKARMTLYAQQDDDGRLLVGPEKANSTAPAPAAVFTITAIQHFPPTDDDDGTIGKLTFAEASDRTARQHIVDRHEAEHGEDRQEGAAAVAWLREYIEAEGPEVNSATAKTDARRAGIPERTLQRACRKLRVVYGHSGFASSRKTTWSLPSANNSPDPEPDGEPEPVRVGANGAHGIYAGHTSAPIRATTEAGANVARIADQQVCPSAPFTPTETTPEEQELAETHQQMSDRERQAWQDLNHWLAQGICPGCYCATAGGHTGQCQLRPAFGPNGAIVNTILLDEFVAGALTNHEGKTA